MRRGWKWLIVVVASIVVLALVAFFVMFGPPRLIETFARPTFCASCHEMEYVYDSFTEEAHADLDSCNDCHLPNDGAFEHYFWEGVLGARDVAQHAVGAIPDDIEATDLSRRWVLENCHRCHDDEIDEDHGEGRDYCWDCHDEVFHTTEDRAGAWRKRHPGGELAGHLR